jgi:hypothetical protein
VLFNCNNDI